jgi:hypothetical protein
MYSTSWKSFMHKTSVSQDLRAANVMNNAASQCVTEVLTPRQSSFFTTLGIMAPSVDNKSKLKTSRSLYKSGIRYEQERERERRFVSVAPGSAKTQKKIYMVSRALSCVKLLLHATQHRSMVCKSRHTRHLYNLHFKLVLPAEINPVPSNITKPPLHLHHLS